MYQRHQGQQEIRGSVAEGSAVRPSGFPNSEVVQSFHADAKPKRDLPPRAKKIPSPKTGVLEAFEGQPPPVEKDENRAEIPSQAA